MYPRIDPIDPPDTLDTPLWAQVSYFFPQVKPVFVKESSRVDYRTRLWVRLAVRDTAPQVYAQIEAPQHLLTGLDHGSPANSDSILDVFNRSHEDEAIVDRSPQFYTALKG